MCSQGVERDADKVKARYTEEDDPKRLIGLDAAIQDVVTLYQGGDVQAALARVKEVLVQRPDMPLALQHLAYLQRQSGDLAGAVATLKRAPTPKGPFDRIRRWLGL